MALGADDLKSSQSLRLVVQLDIRTAASHVGGDGHCLVDAGLGHDLSLQLVELGVEHLVGDAFFLEHAA